MFSGVSPISGGVCMLIFACPHAPSTRALIAALFSSGGRFRGVKKRYSEILKDLGTGAYVAWRTRPPPAHEGAGVAGPAQSGQKIGMKTAATTAISRLSGMPMRRKSVKLYPPGP